MATCYFIYFSKPLFDNIKNKNYCFLNRLKNKKNLIMIKVKILIKLENNIHIT